MKRKFKKKYKKPTVTKVRLETKVSVLGHCKNTGSSSPLQSDCGKYAVPCPTIGS